MKKIYELKINSETITLDENNKSSTLGLIRLTDDLYMGNSSSYYINKKHLDSFNIDNLKNISKTVNLQDKTIYRYPKLNLPRQKTDLLKERYNMKVTRNPHDADIHVLSTRFLDTILNIQWLSILTFDEVYKSFIDIKKKGHILNELGLNKLELFLSQIDKDSVFSYNKRYSFQNPQSNKQNLLNEIDEIFVNNQRTYTENKSIILNKECISHFINIKNSKAIFILDEDIIKMVDDDLTILDESHYDQLKNMVKSTDIENTTLALEILANSNLEKSFDIISSLYYWNNYNLKNSKNWNSVNVKTLRSRLNKYNVSASISSIYSFNKYLKLLKEDSKLTEWSINNTKKLLLETYFKDIIGENSKVFKINLEDIKLDEKFY